MHKRFTAFFFLFVFECIRLGVGVKLLTGRVFTGSGIERLLGLVFAAPCALFPLLAFFFWFDSARYSLFKLPYIAGKAVCVFCTLAAFAFYLIDSGANMPDAGLSELSASAGLLGALLVPDIVFPLVVFFTRKSAKLQ
ncbi:MAG: hypothetical protein LBG74_05300 [Spirochaetaceae bacterium]|jgi:hypothetical protein|nr:hypothetical protein [Spirochaetaceae bacterium]